MHVFTRAAPATPELRLLRAVQRQRVGFMEPGYDPTAIMASRGAELASVAFLGGFVVARFVRRVPVGRW